jgi:hypothetical protein
LKETLAREEQSFEGGVMRFFKLFQESTFGGSRAAAQKMKEFAKRQIKHNQRFLLFHSLHFLIRFNSEMLSWPNSPLLVMLQFVDPNEMFGEEEMTFTLLYHLAELADAFDYSIHENQLILANQLIEHGANVSAVSIPTDITPLHRACFSAVVTNLDFVELLLKKDADPNAQDHLGLTPLMYTTPYAPGAAKFLLNWPTTDANITFRCGTSFLVSVRSLITTFSDEVACLDNPNRIEHQLLLQQWREIEDMLVERGAHGTRITAIE